MNLPSSGEKQACECASVLILPLWGKYVLYVVGFPFLLLKWSGKGADTVNRRGGGALLFLLLPKSDQKSEKTSMLQDYR